MRRSFVLVLVTASLLVLAGPAAAQPSGGLAGAVDPASRPRPTRLSRDDALTGVDAFVRRARQAGATADALAFLDLGVARSPYRDEVDRIPERLGRRPDGAALTSLGPAPRGPDGVARAFDLFPPRGERPAAIHEDLAFLPAAIVNACVANGNVVEGRMRVRWHGRAALEPQQCWSATKHVQALHVVTVVGAARPDLDLADTWLRAAGGGGPRVRVVDLLRDVVTYDAGVARSNAGAATLGELFARRAREDWNEAHTGHDHDFRGNYGVAPLFARPELVDAAGRVLLTAPPAPGPTGPNLISTYDLTRLTAMAAWHLHLQQEARLAGAQWRALDDVLLAMGHDPARYVDVAIDALGVAGRVRDVAVATKLGYGVRSATGLPELVYAGALTFVDGATSPPTQRHLVFALRATHRDAVVADATLAAAVTELLRRVLDEDLL